jgi:hypothetical protein
MAAFLSIPGLRNYFLPKILYSIYFLSPPFRLKIYVNNLRFKAKSTLKKNASAFKTKRLCVLDQTQVRFK